MYGHDVNDGDTVRVTFTCKVGSPAWLGAPHHAMDVEVIEKVKPITALLPPDWNEQIKNNYLPGFAGGLPAILELLRTWVDDSEEATKSNPNGSLLRTFDTDGGPAFEVKSGWAVWANSREQAESEYAAEGDGYGESVERLFKYYGSVER